MLSALFLEPQDNNSEVVLGGIGSEVAEPNIQRQQCAPLGSTPFDDPGIAAPPEPLVPDSDRIVAMLLEKLGNSRVQVLVGFESNYEMPSTTMRSLASSAA